MGGTVTSGGRRWSDDLLGLASRSRWRGLTCPRRGTDLAPQPADLDGRPDQQRFGLERREPDPDRVARASEHHESRHPFRRELGIELVERLDLEPARQEEQAPPP